MAWYCSAVSTAVSANNSLGTQLQQYRTLLEILGSIALHRNLTDLFQDLAVKLHKVIRFEFITVILHDPEKNVMRLHLLETPLPHDLQPGFEEPIEETIAGTVWQTQKSLTIGNVDSEARFPQSVEILRQYGVKSVCSVPLTTALRRLGVLGFGIREQAAYGREDVELLEQVGRQIAVAVDNALHQQEAERYRGKLQTDRDQLRLLLDLNNALVFHLALPDLFKAISACLRDVLQNDYTSLSLYDSQSKALVVAGLDFPQSKGFIKEGIVFPIEGSPAGRAYLEQRPIRLRIPDPEGFPAATLVAAEGLKSGLVVPLIARNRVLGTIGVASIREQAFSDSDVELLVQVATQIAIAVENALSFKQIEELKNRLAEEKLYLEHEIQTENNFEDVIGKSETLKRILRQVETVAATDSTVLILGETGTGKELIARAIHKLSPRRQRTFVKLNCAAIPTGLLESELFGHEKGAFTGAIAQKIGRYELAHQGTLFLDEVGDIPGELQPKLLRVLQEQEFERLGSTRTIRSDVRLVAATNRDLLQMVREREFRSDLYYRLNVFPILIPPLRERRDDIPLLVRYFAEKFSRRMNKQIETVPVEAMNACLEYHWPGNVRELENFVERAVILSSNSTLQLPIKELRSAIETAPSPVVTLESAEREHIMRALRETNWMIGGAQGAAARLGMKRTTLQSKMKKLGISRPDL